MATFPLPFLPKGTWHYEKGGLTGYFGAPRSWTEPDTGKLRNLIHGACDLLAPAGTPIYAVEDGTIIRGPYKFLVTCSKEHPKKTFAIDVVHRSFTARYGEIALNLPKGVALNKPVKQGDVIAFVGDQCGNAMLHFELFKDVDRQKEVLTVDGNDKDYLYVPVANYGRRNDLLDPTDFLDRLALDLRFRLAVERAEVYDPLLDKGGKDYQETVKKQNKILKGEGSFRPRTTKDGPGLFDYFQ
jgi:murein DD-endopeptidase MepM/ murein hydrolase activator NlpD